MVFVWHARGPGLDSQQHTLPGGKAHACNVNSGEEAEGYTFKVVLGRRKEEEVMRWEHAYHLQRREVKRRWFLNHVEHDPISLTTYFMFGSRSKYRGCIWFLFLSEISKCFQDSWFALFVCGFFCLFFKWVFCLCRCLCTTCMQDPQKPEEGIRFCGIRVMDGCKLGLHWCLEEQPVHLTDEPSVRYLMVSLVSEQTSKPYFSITYSFSRLGWSQFALPFSEQCWSRVS